MARILIADDDQQVRVMLKMTLERAGYEVIEAEDGNEAVKQFKSGQPDLVVTDIVMPEKEGIETIMESSDPALNHLRSKFYLKFFPLLIHSCQ